MFTAAISVRFHGRFICQTAPGKPLFPATPARTFPISGTCQKRKIMTDSYSLPLRHFSELREALLEGQDVALVDLREEAAFATGHPLFAANLALSKLELEVLDRIPNRLTAITLYDNGEFYDVQRGERKTMRAAQLLK